MQPIDNDIAFILLSLGIIFMLAEIAVYTFGIFAISGTLLYLVGITLLLVAEPHNGSFHDGMLFVIIFVGVLAMVLVGIRLSIRAFKKPIVTGREGLLNEVGVVVHEFNKSGKGRVHIHGEIWEAQSDQPLQKGDEVVVMAIQNLVLKVKKRGANNV